MKKAKIFIPIIVVFLLALLFIFLNTNDKTEFVPYKTFIEKVDEGKITKTIIQEDKIIFTEEEKEFYTNNPNSNDLKEKLLMNEIEVVDNKSFMELFYEAFDVLFVVIFLGGIYIIYRRASGKTLFKVIKNEKTKFSDVVGMSDLKEEMMQVVDIMKNRDAYLKKGIKQPRGIILEGEPGNGKTLFARALAGEAHMNFIATKGADFESAVMAIGPQKIRSLFRIAKKHAPVIIFIDEFDGIGTKRNYNGSAVETENTRIVTALLNELDGFKPSDGVFVIAATNNSKVLDPALIRPGRFDRKYLITNPNEQDRIDLIKFYLRNMQIDDSVNIEKLANSFKGECSSRIAVVMNEAGIIAARKNNNIVNDMCIKLATELTKEK